MAIAKINLHWILKYFIFKSIYLLLSSLQISKNLEIKSSGMKYSPDNLEMIIMSLSKNTEHKYVLVFKYGVFSWYLFSCIWPKYRDLRRNSPYSVRIQENTDQKKFRIWTLFTRWRFLRRRQEASVRVLEYKQCQLLRIRIMSKQRRRMWTSSQGYQQGPG